MHMKTILPVFVVIFGLALGLTHAQAEEYKLSIRVFQPMPKSEGHPVIYSISNIKLSLDEPTNVTMKTDYRSAHGFPYKRNVTESCELLLTSEPDGKFQLRCEWNISNKARGSAATESVTYTQTLTPDKWSFTPVKGEERYLAFHLRE